MAAGARALGSVDGVELWVAGLDTELPDDGLPWLSASEIWRAARFIATRDARRYRAAHLALRRILHETCAVRPQIEYESGPFGKPALAAPRACEFSLSHSGALALIGTSRQFEIGVDIEELRPMDDVWPLAQQHFTAAEIRDLRSAPPTHSTAVFLQCWTRKEACLKAAGMGLGVAPRAVAAGIGPGTTDLTVMHAGTEFDLTVRSVAVEPGHIAAVARLKQRRPRHP